MNKCRMNVSKFSVLISVFFLSCSLSNAQYNFDDWHPPIAHAMLLSGSFGELRPNHFHGGIDIKSSKGSSGDPIFSVQDGYISRVLVHPRGYGNAIFINHPNGFTTVYAHLDGFEPGVKNLFWQAQKETKNYVLDYELSPTAFPVKKGQLIGYMGNSGHSFGPHLHFEMKRTDSDLLINPLFLGYLIKDNQPPVMKGIRIHTLDSMKRGLVASNYPVRKTSSIFKPNKDTLVIKGPTAAISIDVIDFMDGAHNKNGIYRLELFVDDKLIYTYQMDSFPKIDTRCLNAHCDYGEIRQRGNYYHRLHKLIGNKIELYPHLVDNGYINLGVDEIKRVKIAAYDYHKNMSISSFFLKRDSVDLQFAIPNHQYFVPCQFPYTIREDSMRLEFKEHTFFEDTYLRLQSKQNDLKYSLSKTYYIHDANTPINGTYNLNLIPTIADDLLKDKILIANCESGTCVNMGGYWNGNYFSADLKKPGAYTLIYDTIPPRIRPVKFNQKGKKYKDFRFQITDNLIAGIIGVELNILATINGHWVRGEYDKYHGILTLHLDDVVGNDLNLEITATDAQNNQQIASYVFSR